MKARSTSSNSSAPGHAEASRAVARQTVLEDAEASGANTRGRLAAGMQAAEAAGAPPAKLASAASVNWTNGSGPAWVAGMPGVVARGRVGEALGGVRAGRALASEEGTSLRSALRTGAAEQPEGLATACSVGVLNSSRSPTPPTRRGARGGEAGRLDPEGSLRNRLQISPRSVRKAPAMESPCSSTTSSWEAERSEHREAHAKAVPATGGAPAPEGAAVAASSCCKEKISLVRVA